LNKEEHHTLSEDYLRGQLIVLLAGRAAEKLLIGTVSSGADDDIKRATELARSMVSRWGMDQELGPVNLRQSEEHPFLGQSIAQPRDHADETAARVDHAIIDLLKGSEEVAMKLLQEHLDELRFLVKELEDKEVLSFDEIQKCLTSQRKIMPLKSEKQGSS
jgi:cell division protease FtsH